MKTNPTVERESDTCVMIELRDLDLSDVADLEGSALEAILRDIEGEAQATDSPLGHNSHHSHSSFSRHGTGITPW